MGIRILISVYFFKLGKYNSLRNLSFEGLTGCGQKAPHPLRALAITETKMAARKTGKEEADPIKNGGKAEASPKNEADSKNAKKTSEIKDGKGDAPKPEAAPQNESHHVDMKAPLRTIPNRPQGKKRSLSMPIAPLRGAKAPELEPKAKEEEDLEGDGKQGWGGRREGSGRKKSTRECKSKRVPVDLIPHIEELIKLTEGVADMKDEEGSDLIINLPMRDAPKKGVPMLFETVQAGFPSPAESYIDDYIDMNEYLITNPPATFLVRAGGNSMLDAGIEYGDILIVDRSLNARSGDIVMADLGNRFTIKRLHVDRNGMSLHSENSIEPYPNFYPSEGEDWQVLGVVTFVIKKFR